MAVQRTYGLSGSGIDVDSVVSKLMVAARQPYVKLQQQETVLGWQKQEYNKMYAGVNTFNNTTVFNFNTQSALSTKAVTSSNTAVATVTAKSDVVNENHTLKVSQLASGVTEGSSQTITTGPNKTSLANQFGVSGSLNIKINNKDIAVSSGESINDLVSDINKAGASVSASYDPTADRFFLSTTSTGANSGIDFSGSSAAGLSFLSDKLKMTAYGDVDNNGIGSSAAIGIDESATLQSQFSTLTGSFNLRISDGTTNKTITIDTTKNSIGDLVSQINGITNSGGTQMAVASFVNGKFTLRSNTGAPLSLVSMDPATSGNPVPTIDPAKSSDPAAIDFLKNQLKLPMVATAEINNRGITGNVLGTLQNQFAGLTGTFTMKISDGTNVSTIAVNTATDSISDMISKINALKDSSGKQLATASFTKGKFTIKACNSDTNLDLSGSDTGATSFFTNCLNLTSKKGQDAKIKLDGISMTEPNNKFTVAGVTYNAISIGTATVGITTDVEKIVSNIKTFVEAYNKQLSSIYSEVNEHRYTDYPPLTDEQKASMKEMDISLWTTKAQSGMLHNDSILKTLGESMRNAFADTVVGVEGAYKNAASLGITTSNDYTENGKLYVDETALTKALQADPNAAYKVFGTTGTTAATSGIGTKLSNVLKIASTSIVTQAGTTTALNSDLTSAIGKNSYALTQRMSTMSGFLSDEEKRYYTQFNAMEKAMSKLTQQSSSLSSLMSNS